jgi:formate-dependent nitrite reductase cytochrome c552 subunit
MQLGVNSASCQKCHTETYEQWQGSSHGQANVQCISCHLSHSQEFRLTDEALCDTCHRQQLNDFAHTTHAGADLTCTDCHLSAATRNPSGSAGPAEVTGSSTPPNHSFVVTSQTCIDCHERTPAKSVFHAIEPQNKGNEQTLELAARLKAAEQTNLWLKGLSVAGLGAGLGIGGMLGIVFVLVVGQLTRRRKL